MGTYPVAKGVEVKYLQPQRFSTFRGACLSQWTTSLGGLTRFMLLVSDLLVLVLADAATTHVMSTLVLQISGLILDDELDFLSKNMPEFDPEVEDVYPTAYDDETALGYFENIKQRTIQLMAMLEPHFEIKYRVFRTRLRYQPEETELRMHFDGTKKHEKKYDLRVALRIPRMSSESAILFNDERPPNGVRSTWKYGCDLGAGQVRPHAP